MLRLRGPLRVARARLVGSRPLPWYTLRMLRKQKKRRKAERVEKAVQLPKVCSGCGIGLQQARPFEPGFVPKEQVTAYVDAIRKELLAQQVEKPDPAPCRDRLPSRKTYAKHAQVVAEPLDSEEAWERAADPEFETLGGADFKRKQKYAVSVNEDMVCARCYQLRHYGQVREGMKGIVADDFRDLIAKQFYGTDVQSSVIIMLLDICDLHGSYVDDIKSIVRGRNPIVVALNKADLLCKSPKYNRLREWVKHEVNELGINTHSTHIVSSKTGLGLQSLMSTALELAARDRRDVYIVGASNSGKSTLLNKLQQLKILKPQTSVIQDLHLRRDKPNKIVSTVSSLPGTTLGLLPYSPRGEHTMSHVSERASRYLRSTTVFDTPGILQYGHLHHKLDSAELKAVLLSKTLRPITLLLKPQQTLMIGALAALHHLGPDPFQYTVYCSSKVSIHRTKTERVPFLLDSKVGDLLFPPFSKDRLEELPKWSSYNVDAKGTGMRQSCADVALTGIGWVALTGPRDREASIRVDAMTSVHVRRPILPYDALDTYTKFTGAPLRK